VAAAAAASPSTGTCQVPRTTNWRVGLRAAPAAADSCEMMHWRPSVWRPRGARKQVPAAAAAVVEQTRGKQSPTSRACVVAWMKRRTMCRRQRERNADVIADKPPMNHLRTHRTSRDHNILLKYVMCKILPTQPNAPTFIERNETTTISWPID